MKRLPVIGLIGGIGAGKTTAARCLAARHGAVIDCDKLGHEALNLPEVQEKLRGLFGDGVLNPDGTANRRAIAAVVFENESARKALEGVVFPVIGQLTQTRIDHASQDPSTRFIVLDAAVLLEAGWKDRCDRILYLDAPRVLREHRVFSRSQWTPADLTAREQSQWPAELKKTHADCVLVNDGSEAELQAKIDHVLTTWLLMP